mmetsp:Transcript_7173/g.13008  ORF Transcript_7173/g.13008 Transcript_7173/m.13008 type:complete len:854 (+) Transcript_7173:120-2681(+)
MSDDKQEGVQQRDENSQRPAAAATATAAPARPPSTPGVRATNRDPRPPPSQRRATAQTRDSDCIARQTSIRFRHSDVDSFGDNGSLSSGGESSSSDSRGGDTNGNGGPTRMAGIMEVMDLRPPPSGRVGGEHRGDRASNRMEACSSASDTGSRNSRRNNNNIRVGNSSADGGGGGGDGGDASSRASGESGKSGKAPEQPNHWHEAGSLFPPSSESEVTSENATMSNLGRRKSTLDGVVVEGKFLLGESEQAYRSLQRLLNNDDHKKRTATADKNERKITTVTSLKSFGSIRSNNSNNTGFNSAPPHPGYDRDSGSESSTGSSKLWDAMESSHASHNSIMSIYSTMTEESNPLALERRRQMERRHTYVRRCAKAMAGFGALAALSMSAIYLIGEDHHHHRNRNESSSVFEELLSFGSGRLHPHGHVDEDRTLLDATPPSYPWMPPEHDDDDGDDPATWSSPGRQQQEYDPSWSLPREQVRENYQAWPLPGTQEEGNNQAWSLPEKRQEENDQSWSLPGKQEEEFYQAWPSLYNQQEENDRATWSHSLPGRREADEAGFRYYMNDPVEVITPQERTRREREARERGREERLKEQEQRATERERKRNDGRSRSTVAPGRDRTLGGREERAVPPSREQQQREGTPRLTLNQLREERMRAREERLKEQEQRLLERELTRNNGQLPLTPQQDRARTAREEPLLLTQEHRRAQATAAPQDRTPPGVGREPMLAQERRARMTEEEQLDYFINMDVGARYDVVERIAPQERARMAREERELAREQRNGEMGVTPQELTRRAREERELARERRDQLGIAPQELARRAREERVLAQQQQVQMQREERARREELALLREMEGILE